ncbi:YhcN/YlaJ family sporulation lipoprotein [Cohnella zeiphila]|uniref:YhcN/YlaJ family sporulation lipoprotein n=1 Tax=Cohnella zeiphila TaxID=2761120 RepID=A0A7X0SMG2_9BACL|nr:YhcN/YlaJ family sporulation lipoprotein [Cohnella zeiphila]MBB6732589.1 YhcN/YlaJ family sporulation lipoprotein [Cohnella zeiphila]
MHKMMTVSTVVLSTALALTGCMAKQGDVGNKNIRSNNYRMHGANGTRFLNDQAAEQNRIHGTQQMNNNVGSRLHGNSKLEMSQKIADQLAALPEVKSAYVMLTNRNAYVAISDDKDGMKIHNRNRGGTHTITPYSLGAAPDRGVGPNNPNSAGWNGHVRSNNGVTAGGGTTAGGTGLTGTNGAGMPGAAGTATDQEVSDLVKNKVADIVKGMAPTTDNVYVSSNADFYGRMKGFADQVSGGHPIQGFVTEFNALVNRIFPTEAGTYNGARTYSKTAPSYYAPTTPSHGTARGMTR